MRKQNKLIYFSNVVYALSKDYGFKTDLYRPTETMDFETGLKTVTRVKYKIKKAIFFPNELFRDFNYARLIGQELQFGGILDASQRRVLINKKWLPKNFEIQVTDYVIFNHKRYEIQRVGEMELADYWHLIIKEIKGILRNETFDRVIKDKLMPEELVEQLL